MKQVSGKRGGFNKKKYLPLIIGGILLVAIAIPTGVKARNNILNSQQKKQTTFVTQNTKSTAQTQPADTGTTTSSTDTQDIQNNKQTGAATGTNGGNQTTPQTSPSTVTPSTTPPKKITNWSVVIYQKNLQCGAVDNPCSMPAGLVLSIMAIDNDTGEPIALADCSIPVGPVGFSVPGGSWSANPTVYQDAGKPVCGGGIDFPMPGHYRISYEVWPANSVNMDLRYKGGVLQDFYVKP